MPGRRAPLRPSPDNVLADLEREGQENTPLLREIVIRVFRLGPSLVGDANKTRALAIHAVGIDGGHTPQFFAILTDGHKGLHKDVGDGGFSLQIAFRKSSGVKPKGREWKCDRFDYKKGNQIWWRYDVPQEGISNIDSVLADAKLARDTFVNDDCRA